MAILRWSEISAQQSRRSPVLHGTKFDDDELSSLLTLFSALIFFRLMEVEYGYLCETGRPRELQRLGRSSLGVYHPLFSMPCLGLHNTRSCGWRAEELARGQNE